MPSYDNELNKRIYRTVKNFNQKVKYNKTKTRGKGMLPRRVKVKDLKMKFSDKPRTALEKELSSLEAFSSRKALNKSDGRMSQWEYNYFKQHLPETKKFYDKEIKELERIIGNKPDFYYKSHLHYQTLLAQRKELDKPLTELDEDDVKSFRAYINYSQRSEMVKAQGFRLYLSQLERAMHNLGYTQQQIDELLNKFNQLTENEFLEMVRQEDIIDSVYDLIDSPKERGEYELMADEFDAMNTVESIISIADDLIKTYKKHK